MVSDAKRLANQRNAQNSTGPRTAAGKARSARNATQHGLTAKTLVLDEAQQPEWQRLRAGLIERFAPSDADQERIIDAMLPIAWKLARAAEAEAQATIEFQRNLQPRGWSNIADLLTLDFEQLAKDRRTRGTGISRALLLSALKPRQAISGIPLFTFARYTHGLEKQWFRLLQQFATLRRAKRSNNTIMARSKPETRSTEVKSDAAA